MVYHVMNTIESFLVYPVCLSCFLYRQLRLFYCHLFFLTTFFSLSYYNFDSLYINIMNGFSLAIPLVSYYFFFYYYRTNQPSNEGKEVLHLYYSFTSTLVFSSIYMQIREIDIEICVFSKVYIYFSVLTTTFACYRMFLRINSLLYAHFINYLFLQLLLFFATTFTLGCLLLLFCFLATFCKWLIFRINTQAN
jgi:hypothetical protein